MEQRQRKRFLFRHAPPPPFLLKRAQVLTFVCLCVPQCGTCWQLTYNGRTINVLAIDHAASGFNIAKAALDTLTNGQAEALGRVTATAVQTDVSACGV